MRGEIISIDGVSGDGLISGDDGVRYSFAASASSTALHVGEKVDFVGSDGVASDIMGLKSATMSSASAPAYAPGFSFGSALFSFSGRLRRSHFWISWIIMVAVWWLTFWIPFVNLAVQLVLLWTNLATGAKRFHDMGKPGWLIAIPWVLLILAQVVFLATIGISAITDPQAFESEDPSTVLALLGPGLMLCLIAVPVSLAFWLWLGVGDSQPGRNKYGPNPKDPAQT